MEAGRLLIVTHSYLPQVSPRAFRWSAIAEHWAAQGHRVHVVCWRAPGLVAEERLRGVHVHRVGGSWLAGVRRRFAAESQNGLNLVAGVSQSTSSPSARQASKTRCRDAVAWLYGHTWKAVRWPDYAASWYFPGARRVLHLLREEAFQGLITSSHPFTDHLVGLRAKRALPELPWIVDVGDPFSFLTETPVNNARLYGRLNTAVERKVFDAADAVAVTNEGTRRIYAEMFPGSAQRIRVIPPLVRPHVPHADASGVFPADGKLRLVFVGRLYSGIRAPERLLRLFSRLLETPLGPRLELHFFGWTAGCEEFFRAYAPLHSRSLFLHGPVAPALARRAMGEADFLVNIGNTTSYQLPSKLVEYAETGRPIINFASASDDSSALLLRTYPAALSVFAEDDEQQSAAQWRKFLENPPRVDPEQLREWLRPFRIDSIVPSYELLLEQAQAQTRRAPARCVPAPHFRSAPEARGSAPAASNAPEAPWDNEERLELRC